MCQALVSAVYGRASDKLLPVTSAFIDIICMELEMQRLDSEAIVDKILLLAFCLLNKTNFRKEV